MTRNSLAQEKIYTNKLISRSQNDNLELSKSIQRTIDQPLNEDLKDALIEEKPEQNDEIDEEEFYYKLHRGLVKIQAMIRGYLQRKKVENLLSKKTKFLKNY